MRGAHWGTHIYIIWSQITWSMRVFYNFSDRAEVLADSSEKYMAEHFFLLLEHIYGTFFEYEKCVYISVWDKNRIILNHFSLRSFSCFTTEICCWLEKHWLNSDCWLKLISKRLVSLSHILSCVLSLSHYRKIKSKLDLLAEKVIAFLVYITWSSKDILSEIWLKLKFI